MCKVFACRRAIKRRQQTKTISNDPSAGSPTETLLRLLLPLNDQVCPTFRLQDGVAPFFKPIRRPH